MKLLRASPRAWVRLPPRRHAWLCPTQGSSQLWWYFCWQYRLMEFWFSQNSSKVVTRIAYSTLAAPICVLNS